MIKSISLFIFIICFYFANAQFEKATINTSHIVTHINCNGDILHGMRTTDQDIVLTKFDIRGNIQWSKKLLPFVDNGDERDLRLSWSNELLENGEFIYVGTIDPPDPKVVFSKLNAQGEVNFTKIIRYPSSFIPYYQFGSENIPKLIVYDDDSYLIMNYFLNEDESNYYYSFIKFNSEGNVLWHKVFKDLLPEQRTPIVYINKIGADQTALIRDGFHTNTPNIDIDEVDNILLLDKNFNKLKSLKIA